MDASYRHVSRRSVVLIFSIICSSFIPTNCILNGLAHWCKRVSAHWRASNDAALQFTTALKWVNAVCAAKMQYEKYQVSPNTTTQEKKVHWKQQRKRQVNNNGDIVIDLIHAMTCYSINNSCTAVTFEVYLLHQCDVVILRIRLLNVVRGIMRQSKNMVCKYLRISIFRFPHLTLFLSALGMSPTWRRVMTLTSITSLNFMYDNSALTTFFKNDWMAEKHSNRRLVNRFQ